MKLKAMRPMFVAGKPVAVGDEFEVAAHTGRSLVLMGKAVEVAAAEPIVEVAAAAAQVKPAARRRKSTSSQVKK